ncbi:MAG TPA: phenolic acid decarboxylase subunit B, partial [Rhodospirillales bacterium]|nr:phenolic acid decarboxylase subunit B [Rhodospirillales bacterium]
MASRKIIIGMTGASGSVFGIRLLEALKESDVETHVIASKWAQRTMEHETSLTVEKLRDLADV